MKRAPMTQKGAARLRAELDRLKSVERPRIIQAIAEARAHGDLKENAEYHAAREQQGFTEGRINELEAALSYAEVIDVSRLNAGSKIVFGATVDLADEELLAPWHRLDDVSPVRADDGRASRQELLRPIAKVRILAEIRR